LSARLRQRIELALKQYAKWHKPIDPADEHPARPDELNETLFDSWDIPTSYKMSSGYQTGDRAVYDVIYYWGRGTQYEGDSRTTSVKLIRENGRWYVDDLQTHAGKYVSENSLYESLVRYHWHG
jgi:hypothetical protein